MASRDEGLAEAQMAPKVWIGVAVGIGEQDRDQHGGGRIAGKRERLRRNLDTRRALLN
jgi:hypothetical protein